MAVPVWISTIKKFKIVSAKQNVGFRGEFFTILKWFLSFMQIRISRSDLEESKRSNSKFENCSQLENAIPRVSDSRISILGFRIQKHQNLDFIEIKRKTLYFIDIIQFS